MGIVLNTLWSFMSKNVGGGSMFVVFKQKEAVSQDTEVRRSFFCKIKD